MKGISSFLIYVGTVIVLVALIALPFGKQIALGLSILSEADPVFLQEQIAVMLSSVSLIPGEVKSEIKIPTGASFEIYLTENSVVVVPTVTNLKIAESEFVSIFPSLCPIEFPQDTIFLQAENTQFSCSRPNICRKLSSSLLITPERSDDFVSMKIPEIKVTGSYRLTIRGRYEGKYDANPWQTIYDLTNSRNVLQPREFEAKTSFNEYTHPLSFRLLQGNEYSVNITHFYTENLYIDWIRLSPIVTGSKGQTLSVRKTLDPCKLMVGGG